ncbi:MAG TPA: FHA domain-containing protein [Vicinamibacteria bacterium]|nr:FHA domain-containing protein [Vicinamibacteria bacterium]
MIIVCPSCQARYKFDESKLGSRPRARTKCAKCGGSIDIENPLLAAMTLPPGTMAPPPGDVTPPATPPGHDTAPSATPAPAPATQSPALPDNIKRDRGTGTITGRDLHKMGLVELPKDKRFSLAVIQGAATGQIYQITKTRTTMGRSGADINLDDPEASRQHAMLEVIGDHAIVRDLGSTNGTFVDLERIEQQVLNNHMEFRIGSHVLMFIVTEVE